MATVQELVAKFKADTTDFNRKMDGVQKDIKETSNQIKALGVVVGATTVAVGVFAVKVGSAMQQSQKRIEAMLGSAKDAQTVIDSLRQAGFETGASVQELANSFGKLATFVENGTLSLQESIEVSKGLSATSLALGASTEQLNQVMFGFSQAMGSGTVRAEEFNQVTEPLPGIINRMEKAAGLATGELRKMVNDGMVSSEMFKDFLIPALQSFTKEADQMVNTFQAQSGILSNTIQALGEDIYDYLEQPLLDATKALNDFLQQFVSVERKSLAGLRAELADIEEERKRVLLQERTIAAIAGAPRTETARARMLELFKREAEIQERIAKIERGRVSTPKASPVSKTAGTTGRGGGSSRGRLGGVSAPTQKQIETISLDDLRISDEITNEIDIIDQAMDQLSTSVMSSFFEMSQSGKFSFKDMARSMINDLQAIMIKTLAMKAITGITSAFAGSFAGSAGGIQGGMGGLANATSSGGGFDPSMFMVSGARASGGSVLANRSYLVGERGPEILTMGANSGSIMSNQQSFGGGSSPVINIDARGASKGVEQDIRRVMGEVASLRGQVPNIAIAAVRDQNSRTSGFLR